MPQGFVAQTPRRLLSTPAATAKIDSLLLAHARLHPADRESVIVLLEDPIPMPWLAAARRYRLPWQAMSQSEQMVADLTRRRNMLDSVWLASTPSAWHLNVTGRAWIAQAIGITAAGGVIESLAANPRVRFVEWRFRRARLPMGCRIAPPPGSQRPVCSANAAPPSASTFTPGLTAGMVKLEPYLGMNYKGDRIAILDSGLDKDHILFEGADHLGKCFDCVDGDTNCEGGHPDQDIDTQDLGHGTKSASALVAGCAYGPAYRGFANGMVDVFRIYAPPGSGVSCNDGSQDPENEVDLQAVWNAVQTAINVQHDDIIVFETQVRCDDSPTLDDYATRAFQCGVAVIAANGNGTGDPVGSPARAPGTLGIGFYNIIRPDAGPQAHSRGRINGRFKPELVAPSGYIAAANSPDPKTSQDGFAWTSGATPVAGAAAGALLSWMRDISWYPWESPKPVPPGVLYAEMILAGDTPYDATVEDGFQVDRGVGYLSMATEGLGTWGSAVLNDGDPPFEIKFPTPDAGTHQVDASLWWFDPDEPDAEVTDQSFRSDFDLEIESPGGSGVQNGVSQSHHGVFERATAGGPNSPVVQGLWKLKITTVRTGGTPRVVYWAVTAK